MRFTAPSHSLKAGARNWFLLLHQLFLKPEKETIGLLRFQGTEEGLHHHHGRSPTQGDAQKYLCGSLLICVVQEDSPERRLLWFASRCFHVPGAEEASH